MPKIPVYEQQTTPSAALNVATMDTGGAALVRGLESVAQGVQRTSGAVLQVAEQDDMVRAGKLLAERRVKSAEDKIKGEEGAAVDTEMSLEDRAKASRDRLVGKFRDDAQWRSEALNQMKTRRGQVFLGMQLDGIDGDDKAETMLRQAKANIRYRTDAQQQSADTAARGVELEPSTREKSAAEQLAIIDSLNLSDETRAVLRQKTMDQLNLAAALGRAKQNPAGVLEQLGLPSPTDEAIAALSPEARSRVDAVAKGSLEDQESQRIIGIFRRDAREGDKALSALEQSTLPPERLDGIRRKVREGVNLMRDERQAKYASVIAKLETDIATGASVGAVQGRIAGLYNQGALSPSQYATLLERSSVNAVRTAEAAAVQRELVGSLQAGVPLDPQNEQHRKILATAFASDAQGLPVGSPQWQAVALGYASKTRLLPSPAASWLRSAARSPDEKVAAAAAEFYGSLEETSPEATGVIDSDTRAFLASMSGMVEAGAKPTVAFETARNNVIEARRDVIDQRKATYREHVKTNPAALAGFIDRDFDSAFSQEPVPTVALTADFERQTAQYFEKVGDIGLARDLAWKDVQRIYGPSKVNGPATVTAFPVERFGVSPEEVRKDVAEYLKANPQQKLSVDDVLVVPDGLTLRSVNDALTGKPVMPSYRLVTKDGDLVVGADGVPVRYTLPSADELTKRVAAAQAKARKDAELAVAEAKQRRDASEARQWDQAARRIPTGTKE